MIKTKLWITLTQLCLVILSIWMMNGVETIHFPAKLGWGTDIQADIPEITNLDLDSFRAQVATGEERGHGRDTPEKSPTATPVASNPLVLVNGVIIDGAGADPIPNGRIVIQRDQIMAVGRAADLSIPSNAKVIDVTGKTIMPGFINAHVHHTCDPVARHRFLVEGVTATCDLGSSLRCLPNFERDYDWYNRPTARGFKAGPIITVPGGYPGLVNSWYYAVATPEEAQAVVLELLEHNVDVIKIALEPGDPQNPWPVLSLEQVQAIVSTAHSHSLPVRAHVRQTAMLDVALAAGVDVIEHVPTPFCLETELKQKLAEKELHLANMPEFEAQLARMAKQRVILVPTLNMSEWLINHLPGLEPEERQQVKNFVLEIVRRFRELGGEVALGNDYGMMGVQSGMSLREIELLVEAGLTPMEVIEAGTRHAAQVSGYGDELGSLESGKLADVIIVDGNPLIDIQAMSQVIMVIKGGQIVYIREQL